MERVTGWWCARHMCHQTTPAVAGKHCLPTPQVSRHSPSSSGSPAAREASCVAAGVSAAPPVPAACEWCGVGLVPVLEGGGPRGSVKGAEPCGWAWWSSPACSYRRQQAHTPHLQLRQAWAAAQRM